MDLWVLNERIEHIDGIYDARKAYKSRKAEANMVFHSFEEAKSAMRNRLKDLATGGMPFDGDGRIVELDKWLDVVCESEQKMKTDIKDIIRSVCLNLGFPYKKEDIATASFRSPNGMAQVILSQTGLSILDHNAKPDSFSARIETNVFFMDDPEKSYTFTLADNFNEKAERKSLICIELDKQFL